LLCRLLNGGSMTGVEEFIGRRHDGTTLHVAVDVCPVECDGRICGIRGFAMDITESKAAVEALRQSRERLYTLIETAPLPICILDREGRVSDVWNPAAEELLGWSRAEVVGKPFPAVPEQGRDTFEQALIALRDGETLRDIEVHPRARDGSFLTTSLWAARLSDPQGRFCGCIGVLVDLSERKRAEQALRESEERFRDLSDTAPVLIWMAGADRHCFYFNKNWFKFTGRPLQQEYGKGWMSGVHTDDLESCLASYRSAFASRRPFSIEFRLRAADGSYHWVLDCGAPRYNADGAFAGYIGTCTDISDRKAAEEALRESETRFRTIFEGARDPIFIKDSDGKYVQANPATARSLNCTTAELIGRSDDEFFEPGLAAQIAENDRRALAGEAMECEIAFTVAGKEITYHVVKVPLRNANGRITGLVGVARDISEHKCAEEHLREEKEKAQRYLDIVGTVVVAINADQTVNLINQAGCRLLGASEEEIRGLNWFDHFVPERVRRSVREVFAQVIAGDMQHAEHFENPVLTRGGEERVIEWRNTVLRDESGHIIGTLSAGQDVTEQRRSAAVAQVIIEAAPLPMVVMRVADGKILYANGPLRRALGVSEDTADMSTLPYFQNPEMHTRAIEQIRREGAVGPMRVTLNRPDGSPVSFMGAARLFKLEGDDVIVAMAVPITEDAVDTSRSADSPGFASHHLEALYTEIKESLDRARQAAAPKPQDKWET
jgi:PAS domain S-box-containing protein